MTQQKGNAGTYTNGENNAIPHRSSRTPIQLHESDIPIYPHCQGVEILLISLTEVP